MKTIRVQSGNLILKQEEGRWVTIQGRRVLIGGRGKEEGDEVPGLSFDDAEDLLQELVHPYLRCNMTSHGRSVLVEWPKEAAPFVGRDAEKAAMDWQGETVPKVLRDIRDAAFRGRDNVSVSRADWESSLVNLVGNIKDQKEEE